jgi:hypothetical protein
LIANVKINPRTDLVVEETAIRLKDAVRGFLLSWRMNTSSPPGEIRDRAQEIRKRGLAFLEGMGANPDDGDLQSNFMAFSSSSARSCVMARRHSAAWICRIVPSWEP